MAPRVHEEEMLRSNRLWETTPPWRGVVRPRRGQSTSAIIAALLVVLNRKQWEFDFDYEYEHEHDTPAEGGGGL